MHATLVGEKGRELGDYDCAVVDEREASQLGTKRREHRSYGRGDGRGYLLGSGLTEESSDPVGCPG